MFVLKSAHVALYAKAAFLSARAEAQPNESKNNINQEKMLSVKSLSA